MVLENNLNSDNMTAILMENTVLKIHKAALKFLVPLTPQEVYKLIAQEARKLVKAVCGSILMPGKGELVKVYAYPETLLNVKNRKRGLVYKAFSACKPIILDISEYGSIHPIYQRMEVKSFIAVPLLHSGKAIGVLTLHSIKKNAFGPQDILVLQLFASFAALAIKKTQLYYEVEKALETRDHFVSLAAHELKTPITTIHGYIQLLKTRMDKKKTPEARWTNELSGEMSRLIHLVDELLAVNRIKSKNLKYFWKKSSLKGIIKRAIDGFRFAHPNHNIIFNDELEDQPDTITGDSERLLQVVTNLLNNAAKFSPEGSSVTVSLFSRASGIILAIKDQGAGINEGDLPRIFDKFYKGQGPKKEGMGLGLYLVKEIITEHKGKIKVSSKKDKGTTFKIILPMFKHG